MVFALTGMIGSGMAHYQGAVARWLCIPLVALFASLIHELEHDLIQFVVKEPFHIRQWTASQAHRVMRQMRLRFNDFGSFTRANRFRARDHALDDAVTNVT